jgi:hypothetical protein
MQDLLYYRLKSITDEAILIKNNIDSVFNDTLNCKDGKFSRNFNNLGKKRYLELKLESFRNSSDNINSIIDLINLWSLCKDSNEINLVENLCSNKINNNCKILSNSFNQLVSDNEANVTNLYWKNKSANLTYINNSILNFSSSRLSLIESNYEANSIMQNLNLNSTLLQSYGNLNNEKFIIPTMNIISASRNEFKNINKNNFNEKTKRIRLSNKYIESFYIRNEINNSLNESMRKANICETIITNPIIKESISQKKVNNSIPLNDVNIPKKVSFQVIQNNKFEESKDSKFLNEEKVSTTRYDVTKLGLNTSSPLHITKQSNIEKNFTNINLKLFNTRQDCLNKRIKTHLHRYVLNTINKILKAETEDKNIVFKLPKDFISNLGFNHNIKLFKKTVREVYSTKLLNLDYKIYEHNKKMMSITNTTLFSSFKNKTFEQVYVEYLSSTEFCHDINDIKKKEGIKYCYIFKKSAYVFLNYIQQNYNNKIDPDANLNFKLSKFLKDENLLNNIINTNSNKMICKTIIGGEVKKLTTPVIENIKPTVSKKPSSSDLIFDFNFKL